jgi:uncharacterized pyridoxamine 5'-phosphate oxidase family protein
MIEPQMIQLMCGCKYLFVKVDGRIDADERLAVNSLEKPPDILILQRVKENPAVLVKYFENLFAQNVILFVEEGKLPVSLFSYQKAFFMGKKIFCQINTPPGSHPKREAR